MTSRCLVNFLGRWYSFCLAMELSPRAAEALQSGRRRVDRDCLRVGVCGDGGSVHGHRLRKQRRASQSGGDARFAVRDSNFAKFLPYLASQLLGGIAGGALVWLHYLLHGRRRGRIGEAECLLQFPAIRSALSKSTERNHRDVCLVFVVGAIFSKKVAAGGPTAGSALLVGSLVWGIGLSLGGPTDMPLIRRAILSAHCARHSPDRRQRRVRLGLCSDSRDRPSPRRHRGGLAFRALAIS